MIKLAFDLDGVLRSLYPIVRRKFGLWSPYKYYDWDNARYNIYDLVKKDYSVLEKAKPTKYVKVIQDYIKSNGKCIEIWSYQPKDWIEYSSNWLKKYFPNFEAYWLKPEEKYKELQMRKDVILVEDNPNFKKYNRIWIIDQKYNSKVKCEVRIKTVKDLRGKLEEIKRRLL